MHEALLHSPTSFPYGSQVKVKSTKNPLVKDLATLQAHNKEAVKLIRVKKKTLS